MDGRLQFAQSPRVERSQSRRHRSAANESGRHFRRYEHDDGSVFFSPPSSPFLSSRVPGSGTFRSSFHNVGCGTKSGNATLVQFLEHRERVTLIESTFESANPVTAATTPGRLSALFLSRQTILTNVARRGTTQIRVLPGRRKEAICSRDIGSKFGAVPSDRQKMPDEMDRTRPPALARLAAQCHAISFSSMCFRGRRCIPHTVMHSGRTARSHWSNDLTIVFTPYCRA
jgi:hypothetical protein